MDGESDVAAALSRLVEGDLLALGAAIDALPDDNPRKRLLAVNYRTAMMLLRDIARLIRR